MANPAFVLDLKGVNDNSSSPEDEDTRDVELKIQGRHSNELVIALCGAVGSGVKRLKESLTEQLENSGYIVQHIRLSDLIAEQFPNSEGIKKLKGFERYKKLQDLGDKLREDNTHNIVAQIGIRRINHWRHEKYGEELKVNEAPKHAKTLDKVAYIVDQLKNPAEVKLFRIVYKNNFYLVGLLRNVEERKKNLSEERLTEEEINKLIRRDRKFKFDYGQQVEDTLQLSDYFIRNIDQGKTIKASATRFISLIHGIDHISPSKDETGMHTAYNASLRSACLSRQVGSCIVDDNGNILATGCNDVPSFGGGLYNAESKNDKRCYNGTGCYNDFHKLILRDQIKDILVSEGIANSDSLAERIIEDTKAKSIIEYSRAIHAEMDAILSLARNTSTGTIGKIMYCTTYPCHSCARHIVASGIKKVIYIEPYEKSLAKTLHEDAICHTDDVNNDKVLFAGFEGVAPNRYVSFFKKHGLRKDSDGNVLNRRIKVANQVAPSDLDSYFDYEAKIVSDVNKTLGDEP
ncbi:anti-phage dCTP deaminase [Dickeya fangzhongdai]|uniref:anti-phage dCTP deaminase n=1 Tax=Dickeya fangzhongdai TaxID=1778540 RepID=UPI0023E37030|nr:anti-phage dCTP deaminase [Dickeya fangzhongdai]WES90494.1 anti-phage dCTP deaminase [Dickeya fangzhongdai]